MSGSPPSRRQQHTDLSDLSSMARRGRRTKPLSFKRLAPSPFTTPSLVSQAQQRIQAALSGTTPLNAGPVHLNGALPACPPRVDVPSPFFGRQEPVHADVDNETRSSRPGASSPSAHFYTPSSQRLNHGPVQGAPVSNGSNDGMAMMPFQSSPRAGKDRRPNQSPSTHAASQNRRGIQQASVATNQVPSSNGSVANNTPQTVIDLTGDTSESDLLDYEDEPTPAQQHSGFPRAKGTATDASTSSTRSTNAPPYTEPLQRTPVEQANGSLGASYSSHGSNFPRLLPSASPLPSSTDTQPWLPNSSTANTVNLTQTRGFSSSERQPDFLGQMHRGPTVAASPQSQHSSASAGLRPRNPTSSQYAGHARRVPESQTSIDLQHTPSVNTSPTASQPNRSLPQQKPPQAASNGVITATAEDMPLSISGSRHNGGKNGNRETSQSSNATSAQANRPVPVLMSVDRSGLTDMQKKVRAHRGRSLLRKHGIEDLDLNSWKGLQWLSVLEQDARVREIARNRKSQERAGRTQQTPASPNQRRDRQNAAESEDGRAAHDEPVQTHTAPSNPRQDPSNTTTHPVARDPEQVARPDDALDAILGPPRVRIPEASRSAFTRTVDPSDRSQDSIPQVQNGSLHGSARSTTASQSPPPGSRPRTGSNSGSGPEILARASEQQINSDATSNLADRPGGITNMPPQKKQKTSPARAAESTPQAQESRRQKPEFIPPPPRTSSSLERSPSLHANEQPQTPVAHAPAANGTVSDASRVEPLEQDLARSSSSSGASSTIVVVSQGTALEPAGRGHHVENGCSPARQQRPDSRTAGSMKESESQTETVLTTQPGNLSTTGGDEDSAAPQPCNITPLGVNREVDNSALAPTNQGYRVLSLAERLRQERLKTFDSDALDLGIYVQPDAHWPAGLKLSIEAYHRVIPLPTWVRCDPFANPEIHGMQPPLSPADQAFRDAEIAARGGRKFWFGRVAARQRFRIERDEFTPVWLRPRVASRPRDISFQREEQLHPMVRENSGWVAYYRWHRSERLKAYAAARAR